MFEKLDKLTVKNTYIKQYSTYSTCIYSIGKDLGYGLDFLIPFIHALNKINIRRGKREIVNMYIVQW